MGEQPVCNPIRGAQYACVSVRCGGKLQDSDRLTLLREIVGFGFYPLAILEGEMAAKFDTSFWMLVQCEPNWFCDEFVGGMRRNLPLVAHRLSTDEAYGALSRADLVDNDHYDNEQYEYNSVGEPFDREKRVLGDLRGAWLGKVSMAMFPSDSEVVTQDAPFTPQEVARLRAMLAGSSMRS